MLINQKTYYFIMSDPVFINTIDSIKGRLHESKNIERDWWTNASNESRRNILVESEQLIKASEFAYQQESTAKFNQLISTNYDSLPNTVKNSITEALIGEGELPDPSDYEGIGQAFEIGDDGEVNMECDRCDETFTSTEDFDMHKDIDHGDDGEDFNEAEESYVSSMNPDISRYALKQARRLLTETDQGDLTRDATFNGKEIPTPTKLEPDDVKGIQGYNDNPNEGLYDTKRFKTGDSKQRHALESGIDEDVVYDPSESISDIEMVKSSPVEDKDLKSLEGVDFAEENIEYVYPTLKEKSTESFASEDHILDDYSDGDIESELEAVESQIVSRKMDGHGAPSIARELVIQYGISMEEALERANAVEVSVNDRISNTIFGKKYSECTESEIRELELYSGSDNQ